MRATIEHVHRSRGMEPTDSDELPPVKVQLVLGPVNLSIKVGIIKLLNIYFKFNFSDQRQWRRSAKLKIVKFIPLFVQYGAKAITWRWPKHSICWLWIWTAHFQVQKCLFYRNLIFSLFKNPSFLYNLIIPILDCMPAIFWVICRWLPWMAMARMRSFHWR